MDLFKEIFANSDSEDESEETMHNKPSKNILSPALLSECKPVTSSRKQPVEMCKDTQWKDLSVVSSSIKQSEDMKLPSVSLKKYQEPIIVADQSSNKLKSNVASYGPSLPPGTCTCQTRTRIVVLEILCLHDTNYAIYASSYHVT